MAQNMRSIQLVESENARTMPLAQLSETFILTRLFWKMLARRHYVLLGARGQGKTALLRMLAFEGLSALAKIDANVRRIVDAKERFGIYLPTKLEWVQTLNLQVDDSGLSQMEAFSWKFNLSSCLAFVSTVKHCLRYYLSDEDLIVREREFCKKITDVWKLNLDTGSVDDVADYLKQINYEWQVAVSLGRFKRIGDNEVTKGELGCIFAVFSTNAFTPLKAGIDIISKILDIPDDSIWFLCLDEAEYMLPAHQKIINSFMRVASRNLYLKIATMPFSHYTLETNVPGVTISPGDDFEYLHMDEGAFCVAGQEDRSVQDEVDTELADNEFRFGELLFQKVVSKYFPAKIAENSSLLSVFGKSVLLDNSNNQDWSPVSNNMRLLKKHATSSICARAVSLFRDGNYERLRNEVGRKVRGALLLRESQERMRGHRKSDIFSGARMIVRCADGNPRLLIRILNCFFADIGVVGKNGIKIAPRKQEDTLVSIAKNFLNQIRSYQDVGLELFKTVSDIGEFMRKEFYGKPLTGDMKLSIAIRDVAEKDDRHAKLIQAAIKHGVLKPNDLSKINYGARANLAGSYHLSYIFSPLFRIQPRKGKSITFKGMKAALRKLKKDDEAVKTSNATKTQQLMLGI